MYTPAVYDITCRTSGALQLRFHVLDTQEFGIDVSMWRGEFVIKQNPRGVLIHIADTANGELQFGVNQPVILGIPQPPETNAATIATLIIPHEKTKKFNPGQAYYELVVDTPQGRAPLMEGKFIIKAGVSNNRRDQNYRLAGPQNERL